MGRRHCIADDGFMYLTVRLSVFRHFLWRFRNFFIRIVAGPIVRHVFFDRAGIEADFFDAVAQVAGIGNGCGRSFHISGIIIGIPTSGTPCVYGIPTSGTP